ncbi:MAG: hypothetical protein IT463_02860 [Planctomycetes bacterium]|nr:hypothetical protein [Planctomycetota bacterium]
MDTDLRQQRAEHTKHICVLCARWIAERKGVSATSYNFPDEVVRSRPAVDFEFSAGDAQHVLEHTVLEPFDGYIELKRALAADFSAWASAMEPKLPKGLCCKLQLPARLQGWGGASAREALEAWILEVAPEMGRDLESETSRQRVTRVRAADCGVPFNVELSGELNPRGSDWKFWFRVTARQSCEDKSCFERRIQRALERKLPKLKSWRGTCKTSVLLLEVPDHTLDIGPGRMLPSSDIATNLLPPLCTERRDAPDIIVLVDTQDDGNGYWLWWCLKWDEQWYEDLEPGERLGEWWHERGCRG